MSKTICSALVVFMLVCVVVLVAFVIGLVVVNRDTGENGEISLAQQETGTSGNDDESAETPSETTDNEPATTNPTNVQQTQTPMIPTGQRYELMYTLSEKLVLYADDELFEYDAQMDAAYEFKYTDDENASLLIHFEALPQGAQRRAESFLEGYLDGNESHVGGTGPISRSSLSGVFVTGVNDGETFEAWIHELSGDMGMVFVIRYRNNEQRNALYALLDTMNIVGS